MGDFTSWLRLLLSQVPPVFILGFMALYKSAFNINFGKHAAKATAEPTKLCFKSLTGYAQMFAVA